MNPLIFKKDSLVLSHSRSHNVNTRLAKDLEPLAGQGAQPLVGVRGETPESGIFFTLDSIISLAISHFNMQKSHKNPACCIYRRRWDAYLARGCVRHICNLYTCERRKRSFVSSADVVEVHPRRLQRTSSSGRVRTQAVYWR